MSDDGYEAAFYELARLMRIPAQNRSPREVWRTQMLPLLKVMLTDHRDGLVAVEIKKGVTVTAEFATPLDAFRLYTQLQALVPNER